MLKVIPHRRRLLRKSVCRLPHQRNRDMKTAAVIKKANKPYIGIRKTHKEPIIKKPKRKPRQGHKMAYRYRYYEMNNMIEDESVKEEESSEEDSL